MLGKRDKMHINLEKKYKRPDELEVWEPAVEAVLNKYGRFMPSLSFEKGLLRRVKYEVYEVKENGTVHYQRSALFRKYKAEIYLTGFNKNNKIFRDLKKDLEDIAKTDDAEIIKKKFLFKQ